MSPMKPVIVAVSIGSLLGGLVCWLMFNSHDISQYFNSNTNNNHQYSSHNSMSNTSTIPFSIPLVSLIDSGIYNVSTTSMKYSTAHKMEWNEVKVIVIHELQHQQLLSSLHINKTYGVHASTVISNPVYVSLTSISSRVMSVHNSILTMLHGVIKPSRIFLFVSLEEYLIDQGVPIIPDILLCLVAVD